MLSQKEIELIRKSWTVLVPEAYAAGELFYERLFTVAPKVEPLFRGSVTAQSRKLVETLATVVDLLDNLERLVPIAKSLAVRHVGYGVTADQYPLVGEVLIWTLKQRAGHLMDEETVAAWSKAYGVLQTVMTDAAYGPGRRAS